MYAPTYKVAKHLVRILNRHITLKNKTMLKIKKKLNHRSNEIKTKQKPPTDNV